MIVRARAAYARADFDSAATLWRLALAQAEEAGDSARVARALTELGLTAWKRGEYGEAHALGERALQFKLRRGFATDLFQSFNALGLLAWDEGRLQDATQLFQKAETSRAPEDTLALGKLANNVALVAAELGDFARARAGFLRARAAFHQLGESKFEGRALNNLAALDVQLGNPQAAVMALREARLLLRSSGDRAGEQNALGQLGTAYGALGEPGLALAALDSALALARAAGLRQDEASNLELIAGLHRQAGDLQRALQLYQQANHINGELGLTTEQGANLRNSAEILTALGRMDLARVNALEALRLHRASGAQLHELRDLLLLADLAAAAAESRKAVESRLRAAERLSLALGARIARVEVALARASIADRAGDARAVLGALHGAQQDLAQGGYGSEWQAAALRARAYARLARLDSAAAAGQEAVAAVERVRGAYGSAVLRTAFAVDKAEVYGDLVEILLRLGRTPAAFEIADAARSHALLEHLAVASSDASPHHATLRALVEGDGLLRQIDALVARMDTLEETPPPQRDATLQARVRVLAAELAEARTGYEALLVQVAERDAVGIALLGGRPIQVSEVQRVLRPGEALLEYLVTPTRVVVFVVDRGAVRSVASEIPREDLAGRVRLARDLLGTPGPPTQLHRDVLAALHAVLIAPLEQAGLLRGVRRLIIVPHSVLVYLPFSALRREDTGRYLMEDYALLHLPSAAALGVLRGAAPSERGPAGAATAFAPFPGTLPGSLREVRAFRAAIRGAGSREGKGANEARLRQALTTGGIVHIATHGVMNPRNPMFSRIELAAGSGGPDDDGRLEVHELLALRIAAPLVFLSGCETGVGAAWSTQFARGEDYATLAQAFLYAGARTVAATLWQIGDEGAAGFAQEFYARLQTMQPAEALAAAQRELSRSARYASPYYWAGYQVMGDSEGAREIAQTRGALR